MNSYLEMLDEKEKELDELKTANELLNELVNFQKTISEQVKAKKSELIMIKNNCLEKHGNYQKKELETELEELLEAQKGNNLKWKERIKKSLLKETLLNEQELTNFCQVQEELSTLELELGNIKGNIRETEERITIINNINAPITSKQGHVLVGCEIGDNANISYQVEILPKSN